MHLNFCKRILGLNRYTSNAACRSEIGNYPLLIDIKMSLVNYWLRIQELPDDNLTKQAYFEQKKTNCADTWSSTVNRIPGQESRFTVTHPTTVFSKSQFYKVKSTVRSNLEQNYLELWRSHISREDSKLRTFSRIKLSYSCEPYLSIPNIKHRICLSKLRTSNHKLHIETGRHTNPKTPLDNRICTLCHLNEIENETHFLLVCPKYNSLRWQLFSNIHIPENITDKFVYLMTSTDINLQTKLATFIYNAFEQRSM